MQSNETPGSPGSKSNKLHEEANRRALRVRRIRTGILIGLNVVMAVIILLPLLYAVSVALCLQRTVYNGIKPVSGKSNGGKFCPGPCKGAADAVCAQFFSGGGTDYPGQIISCSLAAFSFSFLDFKGKEALFMLVMATMMVPGEATIISNLSYGQQLGMAGLLSGAHCSLSDLRYGYFPVQVSFISPFLFHCMSRQRSTAAAICGLSSVSCFR